MKKSYLGDAVYAEYDGFGISLTTSNGYEVTNEIYLEPSILENLNLFATKIHEEELKAEDAG